MENIIVQILTVGFHHKRGCEIEFMHPNIEDENIKSKQLEVWINLPSLAMPDGCHKNDNDTIYFIIPGIINSSHKVLFGISCFKQISAESVKTKSEDITRNAIQKCVVVLSTLPLFGAIASFLRGITDNYFDIGDFGKNDILIESFHQLNKHFRLILVDSKRKYKNINCILNQDLSVVDLIIRYEYDILTLIKIMLLRRKVLFFMEPMNKLTSTILTFVSLFEGVLESKCFQNSLNYLDGSTPKNPSLQAGILRSKSFIPVGQKTNLSQTKQNKPSVTVLKSPIDISKLQNPKVKEFMHQRTMEKNHIITKSASYSNIQDLYRTKGTITENEKSTHLLPIENWKHSLDIFDENNILLPYANIGMLDILENTNINSFIIGANNQLWKMRSDKFDLIIYEKVKSGGIELNPVSNQAKNDEFILGKLLQLTVLDRRFMNYLLQIIKFHSKSLNSSNIMKSDSVSDLSGSDVTIEIGEDPIKDGNSLKNDIYKFADLNELEEWLRQVLLDYIKAILLNAASLGTKTSFVDFGSNFLCAVQKQSFFKHWYDSIDTYSIVSEYVSSDKTLISDSTSSNLSTCTTGDNSDSRNAGKPQSIMNYDHPGRLIQPKVGDNIPGYYQFKDYADQSKALMNKSVNEFKKFSSGRSGQLKSSMSAGISKLTYVPKLPNIKLGSTLWYNVNDDNDKRNE